MASSAVAFDDMSPQPRVELVIDPADLDAATATVTVLQLSKWGQVPVRSARGRAVAGGLAVTDFEAPPGVVTTYRVEQFDAGGASLGFALNLTAQVTIPEGHAVIADPLVPANALLVEAERAFAAELKHSRSTSFYRAGNETIALSGPRSLLQDVNLRCYTETEEDREMFEAITAESVIVVRTMPSMRLPGSFYASTPDVVMLPWDAHEDGETDEWQLTGQEITRPVIDIVVPTYTWQDVIDYYPTWADLIADRATWLDLIRNPPPSA
jgi:hypothetical protein